MDSPDNYGMKIIAIGSVLSEVTQQARNTLNYWTGKIKSPGLLQIIIVFIPYDIKTNFLLANGPQYFLCLEQKKKGTLQLNLLIVFWALSYD